MVNAVFLGAIAFTLIVIILLVIALVKAIRTYYSTEPTYHYFIVSNYGTISEEYQDSWEVHYQCSILNSVNEESGVTYKVETRFY
jgi:hypothetical protein